MELHIFVNGQRENLILAGQGISGKKTVHRQDNSPTRFLKTVRRHF